jgi:uracil-DNA glycosylase
MDRFASLDELRQAFEGCDACALGSSPARFVFGVGDPHASVMLIGEAPGFHEDQQGEPFVGAAGKLLDESLASIGLSRRPDGGVYIANVLKRRPPGNRDPLPAEVDACLPILKEQVRLIDPEVIVTLGNFATKAILETETGITRLHGRVFHRDGRTIFPTFHPAAALRSTAVEAELRADFRSLGRVLAEGQADVSAVEPGSRAAAPGEPQSPGFATPAPAEDNQLELF